MKFVFVVIVLISTFYIVTECSESLKHFEGEFIAKPKSTQKLYFPPKKKVGVDKGEQFPVNYEKKINPAEEKKEIISNIEGLIANNQLIIFARNSCHFCDLARKLANKHSLEPFYANIDFFDDPQKSKKYLQIKTNQKTFPMIFANQTFIGGFKQLQQFFDSKY